MADFDPSHIESLFKTLNAGDLSQFDRLATHFESDLARLAKDCLTSGADESTDKYVADAMQIAKSRFHEFDGESVDDFGGWLEQILIGTMVEKSAIINPGPATNKVDEKVGEEVGSAEDRSRLFEALGKLPAEFRQVIELRNRDHMPFVEIASQLDKTESEVQLLWNRAIGFLAKELDE